MPIFMNGNQYEDEAHLEAAYSPMLKNMGIDVKPLPPEENKGDERMVVTPNQVQENKTMDKIEETDLGGIPVSDRIYVSPNKTYDTTLSNEEELKYSQKFGPNDSTDYDMRGWYKAHPDTDPNAEGVHYPDTFKKPNHPTFSDQSQYSTDDQKGGTWGNDNGKDFFIPSDHNLRNMSKEDLQNYFKKVEPDVELRMPLGSPTEPAGEFKSQGGTQVAPDTNSSPEPSQEVDWSKYNQPFGELKDTNPVAYKTPYGNIYEQDIKNATAVAMSAGPGTIEGKFDRYINMFIKQPKIQENVAGKMYEEMQAKSIGDMSGIAAADHFHELYTTQGANKAIEFAHKYEEHAPAKDWDLYEEAVNDQHHYQMSKAFEKAPGDFTQVPFNAHAWVPKGNITQMSTEEVQKMKDSWGSKDIDQFKQQPFNPDTWEEDLKAIADAMAKRDPEKKLTAKEAFIEGANLIHDKLMTSFANIKNKYTEAVREPLTSVPSLKKAEERGYVVPAYKGMITSEGQAPNPVQSFTKAYGEMYSTDSPLLAEMYAGWLGKKTDAPRAHGPIGEDEFHQGAQVVPLLINPKDYLVYDAGGKNWQWVNQKAIDEAKKQGKPGIIMKNVWDEPSSTTHLGSPKTVYITLPKGAHTVKSKFAKNFDPSSPDMLNSIAAVGMVGAAGSIAFRESEPDPIDPSLPHK